MIWNLVLDFDYYIHVFMFVSSGIFFIVNTVIAVVFKVKKKYKDLNFFDFRIWVYEYWKGSLLFVKFPDLRRCFSYEKKYI